MTSPDCDAPTRARRELGEEQRRSEPLLRRGYRFIGEVTQEIRDSSVRTDQRQAQVLALPGQAVDRRPAVPEHERRSEQEYFADGVVEDIITGLSRIRWLFVIARNSSFVYKGKAVDVKQVGRELGVRYVLEGGVRKAGSRIRITAQLVEAETGAHLWAEHYDRLLDDIFAVQDEITMSVIGAIEPSLRKAEIERIKRKRPDSLDAYDLVLRALPFLYSAMPGGVATAIPLLEKALELEPDYARAQADLAWCLHHRFSRGEHREEDRTAAIRHAHAAVAGGGDDATTLAVAAFVISLDEHDNATALNLFDRALALSNSNIFALGCSAVTLAWMGKTELAIERAQRALRLSPFDPLNVRPCTRLRFRTSIPSGTTRRPMPPGVRSSSIPASALRTLCWRRRSFGSDASKRPRRRRSGCSLSNPRSRSANFRSRLGLRRRCSRPLPKHGEQRGCRTEVTCGLPSSSRRTKLNRGPS